MAYCAGKTNSQHCIPSISWTGYPSATHGSGFQVRAASAINNKPGLVLYGTSGRASAYTIASLVPNLDLSLWPSAARRG